MMNKHDLSHLPFGDHKGAPWYGQDILSVKQFGREDLEYIFAVSHEMHDMVDHIGTFDLLKVKILKSVYDPVRRWTTVFYDYDREPFLHPARIMMACASYAPEGADTTYSDGKGQHASAHSRPDSSDAGAGGIGMVRIWQYGIVQCGRLASRERDHAARLHGLERDRKRGTDKWSRHEPDVCDDSSINTQLELEDAVHAERDFSWQRQRGSNKRLGGCRHSRCDNNSHAFEWISVRRMDRQLCFRNQSAGADDDPILQ